MVERNSNTAITITGFFVTLLSFISANLIDPSCPGPLRYYEDLECTPVFKNPNATCPDKYNCDHLKNIPVDKCIVNGHEYSIDEALRDEDANPCDIGCTCYNGPKGRAEFSCAVVDCFFGPSKPGCYRKNSPLTCCSGEEVCPENPEDRPTCLVDGKTYKDGEYFNVKSEPNKNCVCSEGYTGENIEPFCALPKRNYCGIMKRINDVRDNCVPVYYDKQSLRTSCSVFSRCQNDKDAVIRHTSDTSEDSTDPDMMCNFGNLTMRVGDELNQATDYNSLCVKCVCEVPPVPTCRRLPDEVCDVTKQPPFDID